MAAPARGMSAEALPGLIADAHSAVQRGDCEAARNALRSVLREAVGAVERGRGATAALRAALAALLQDPSLEDVHLLTGQLGVYLVDDLYAAAAALGAWPALGVLRAAVIACRVRPLDRRAAEAGLLDVYCRHRAQFGGSAYLCAILIETLDALYASAEAFAPCDALHDTVLVPLVAMRSDLVSHRLAHLVATLMSVRAARDATALFFAGHVGAETRLRYLVLQQLLQDESLAADVLLGTCAADLAPGALLGRIVADSALAPAVCDCAVALVRSGRVGLRALAAAVVRAVAMRAAWGADPQDHVGRFLIPRLAKRATAACRELLPTLGAMAEQCEGSVLRGEGPPARAPIDAAGLCRAARTAYVALAAAMLWGGAAACTALCNVVALPVVAAALTAHDVGTRLAAFQVLCRANGGQAAEFDAGRARAARRFFVHALLAAGSAARQQTVAALTSLFGVHVSRLYMLHRDTARLGPAADVAAETAHIVAFWTGVVDLCARALPPLGTAECRMYHRTDVALRTALSLVRAVRTEWTPAEHPQHRPAMARALHEIFAPALGCRALMVRHVAANPYDAVQAVALDAVAELDGLVGVLRSAGAPLPVDGDEVPFSMVEDALATLAASRKPFELDGASRILTLYARRDAVVSMVVGRLEADAAALGAAAARTDSDPFAQSGAIGTLFALRRLLGSADGPQAARVAHAALLLCRSVVAHLSHPTPEACTSFEDDDAEDADDDDDTYTAMAFCWRAVKYGALLLAESVSRLAAPAPDAAIAPLCVARELSQFLMDVRHPGAFTALAGPLLSVLGLCARADVAAMLEDVLAAALAHPAITTTRRSAGMPLCVGALVASAANASSALRNPLLDAAVARLLAAYGDASLPASARVHALNIVRHLARDSATAEAFRRDHIAAPFDAALAAFHDADWAVRNSGMMLFAALMTRVFGVCHDADPLALKTEVQCTTLAGRDLRIVGRDAVAVNVCDVRAVKCDALLDAVSARMEAASRPDAVARWDSDYVAAFAVYPLVAFAQRVRFPAGALDATQRRLLDASTALLCRVLGSRILKARLMAARVLQRLQLEGAGVRDGVAALVRPDTSANTLHGVLLFAHGDAGLVARCQAVAAEQIAACAYLRDLAEPPADIGSLSVDAAEEDWAARLARRDLSAEDAVAAVEAVLQGGAACLPLLEAFWTGEYDVAGVYRRGAVRAWRPEHSAAVGPAWRRLHYLALTDDDEDVRSMACDGRFDGSGPASLPSALEHALHTYGASISDLRDWMPAAARRIASGRARLFEAEALNCFKDLWWQRLVCASE